VDVIVATPGRLMDLV